MSEINDIEEVPEGNFPINFKLIKKYQQKNPSILAKYKEGTYQKGIFGGGSNININLITCEDDIVILSIIKSCIFNWYHIYLLHSGMDRIVAMIYQHV